MGAVGGNSGAEGLLNDVVGPRDDFLGVARGDEAGCFSEDGVARGSFFRGLEQEVPRFAVRDAGL